MEDLATGLLRHLTADARARSWSQRCTRGATSTPHCLEPLEFDDVLVASFARPLLGPDRLRRRECGGDRVPMVAQREVIRQTGSEIKGARADADAACDADKRLRDARRARIAVAVGAASRSRRFRPRPAEPPSMRPPN